MNDGLEKTASSLVIVEKKPQRPGGCVGIFFQLFDWNRRFAKKKLFSKKLLPPVRLKSASKKFGGDEKLPKHRLIADENSGGFPNAKKSNIDSEIKHEMRAPSLVARLMGLESMPALQRDKSKKIQSSSFKPEKYTDCAKEDWNGKKGGNKLELRPQKLQKTSFSERQTMTRFGTDALPFKNVLSKSRKHHQKLPSPVKGPRNLSRRTSSKLMGAATKILEPGLQRSRSKCALTYSNNPHLLPQGNGDYEEIMHLEPSQLNNPDGLLNVDSEMEFSCRNCGRVKNNVESESTVSEKPLMFASPFSHHDGPACDRSLSCEPRHCAFCQDFEGEMKEDYFPVAAQVHKNIRPNVRPISDRRVFRGHIRPQKDASLSFSSNQQTQCQNQMLTARYTNPTRTNPNSSLSEKVPMANVVHGMKNPFSPNQSFSGNNRSRMSARIDNGKFEMEKRIAGRQNDCIPGRKRRPINGSQQTESPVFMNSSVKKQTYGFTPLVPAKEFVFGVQPVNQKSYAKGDSRSQQRAAGSRQVDNHDSFTFNSPVQRKIGTNLVEKRCFESDSCHDRILKRSSLGENDRRATFDGPCPISGDALGALLEQKLKELTCQGEDCGTNAPRKTTAMILQELISALTSDTPFQQNNYGAPSDAKVNINDQSHFSPSKSSTSTQANAMKINPPVDRSPDSEHLSPGSVLEAYFSNESCLSSSLDDSFGYKMPHESVDCSYNKPHTPKHELELLDCATSTTATKHCKELVGDILDSVSETLCCINSGNYGLKGSILDHVKGVLLNSELVLRGAARSGTFAQRGSSVKHLLLDGPETLAGILSMNFGHSLGVDGSEEENELQRFAFDAIIEYLDMRFGIYPEPGAKVSRKLPLCINGKSLLFEIIEHVRKWGDLSGFIGDDLVEWEMSHSLREWTQFDTESYDTGMEISRQLYHVLVDEIVLDLL